MIQKNGLLKCILEVAETNLTITNLIVYKLFLQSLFKMDNSNVTMINCTFEQNNFAENDSPMFLFRSSQKSIFLASNIFWKQNIFAGQGLSFTGISSKIILNSVFIWSNIGISFTFISFYQSQIQISGIELSNNTFCNFIIKLKKCNSQSRPKCFFNEIYWEFANYHRKSCCKFELHWKLQLFFFLLYFQR